MSNVYQFLNNFRYVVPKLYMTKVYLYLSKNDSVYSYDSNSDKNGCTQ